jgi:histidinol-phosphate/aromatic aminotransferase/cobyric acid decarboxylase-like protein
MNAYALAAIPPALLLIARPQLWPWALAVAAFVALAALTAAAHHFRNERDDARAERDRLERELEARPRLRLVTDDLAALDAEATSYTWPAIARDAFPVREWGEEAES